MLLKVTQKLFLIPLSLLIPHPAHHQVVLNLLPKYTPILSITCVFITTNGKNNQTRRPSDWSSSNAYISKLLKVNNKKTQIFFKEWAKDLSKHFSKENIQMAHQKCLTSSVIREMQIKITRYHFPPRMTAMIKKRKQHMLFNKDEEKLEPLVTAGGVLKWCRHFGKLFGCFSKCWTGLSEDPMMPILRKFPREMKTCAFMFVVALYSVAKSGNNPNVHKLMNGWTKYNLSI